MLSLDPPLYYHCCGFVFIQILPSYCDSFMVLCLSHLGSIVLFNLSMKAKHYDLFTLLREKTFFFRFSYDYSGGGYFLLV